MIDTTRRRLRPPLFLFRAWHVVRADREAGLWQVKALGRIAYMLLRKSPIEGMLTDDGEEKHRQQRQPSDQRAEDALSRAIRNPRRLEQLSPFLFALLRLTVLGFHRRLPDHLAIPDAAYRPPWLLATKENGRVSVLIGNTS
jgi:hypothetical protein